MYWALLFATSSCPRCCGFAGSGTALPPCGQSSSSFVGMWLELFIISFNSLHRDFLPSSWANLRADVLGLVDVYRDDRLFMSLIFLFVRFLPMISISEIREFCRKPR